MKELFEAYVVLFEKFFDGFFEHVTVETLGCDCERFVARAQGQSGMADVAKD